MNDTIPDTDFQCARCGGIFTKGWSDEEAAEEARQFSPEEMAYGVAVICDPCYEAFMKWLPANRTLPHNGIK